MGGKTVTRDPHLNVLGERYNVNSVLSWCNSCQRPIWAGERYHRLACLEGGTVFNYKEHTCCADAAYALYVVTNAPAPPVADFCLERMRALLEYDSAIYTEVSEVLTRPLTFMEDDYDYL